MSRTPTITVLKPAQEMFLILLVEQGLSATQAYAQAYPTCKAVSVPAAASRLLKNSKVLTRKGELEAQKTVIARAATRVTAEFLSSELLAVAAEARKEKQLGAASAALMGVAKIHGMLVEKHQVDALIRRPTTAISGPDQMTELQWLQDFGTVIDVVTNSNDDGIVEVFGVDDK